MKHFFTFLILTFVSTGYSAQLYVDIFLANTGGEPVNISVWDQISSIEQSVTTDENGFASVTLILPDNNPSDTSVVSLLFSNCMFVDVLIETPYSLNPVGIFQIMLTADYCPDNGGGGGGEDEICNAQFDVMQGFNWVWTDDSTNVTNADTIGVPGVIYAFVYDYNPNATYSWSFGDEGTSSDPFPTWNYETYGPYELCLTVEIINFDGTINCSDNYCTIIELDEDGFLGLVDGFTLNVINASIGVPATVSNIKPTTSMLKLYPNPAEGGIVNWVWDVSNEINTIELINSLGSVLSRSSSYSIQGEIDVNDIPAGLYFLRLTQGDISTTKQIVIR